MPQTALTYAIPVSSTEQQIKPQNKLTAAYYDESTYNNVRVCKVIGMICYIGGLVSLVCCMFFRKMIGLEYMVMLQLAYFSIFATAYSHPYYGSMQEWDYVNGYNRLKVSIGEAKLVDNEFWVLDYYDYFFVNVNVMIFVYIANYILALILFALSMLSDRSVSRKLKVAAQFFGIEIGFSLMLF